MVMLERPDRGVNELVLWIGTGLLAIALAAATSFALWNQLHRTQEGSVLMAAIIVLGFGLGLIGLSVSNQLVRVFLIVFAIAFVLGFFAGSPVLANLVR
jgi:hypothetical protein